MTKPRTLTTYAAIARVDGTEFVILIGQAGLDAWQVMAQAEDLLRTSKQISPNDFDQAINSLSAVTFHSLYYNHTPLLKAYAATIARAQHTLDVWA